jgi:hypothetical protein
MSREDILDKNLEKIANIKMLAENATHFVEMAYHNTDKNHRNDPENWSFEVAEYLEEAAQMAREIEKELREG